MGHNLTDRRLTIKVWYLSQSPGTCRKFHFLEALDGWWDTISFHQDVVLPPYTLMPLFRHAQDVTRGCPTLGGRQKSREALGHSWRWGFPASLSHIPSQVRVTTFSQTGKRYLVLMGSSYVIPLAISFTDIRAEETDGAQSWHLLPRRQAP